MVQILHALNLTGCHDRAISRSGAAIVSQLARQEVAAMPLYSFHCAECDKDAELLVGFSEKPKCPSCGSKKLQRQVSRVAAPGKSAGLVKAARAQAAREGHFSNYSRAERKG
jgi:putative FmdB family regulatory protein